MPAAGEEQGGGEAGRAAADYYDGRGERHGGRAAGGAAGETGSAAAWERGCWEGECLLGVEGHCGKWKWGNGSGSGSGRGRKVGWQGGGEEVEASVSCRCCCCEGGNMVPRFAFVTAMGQTHTGCVARVESEKKK